MPSFLQLILSCFYFILPAYFANMAPVIVKKINVLVIPIDFNRQLGGKPIFGKNKTFRGLFFGVLFAIVIAYLQYLLRDTFSSLALVDYSNWLVLGFLMGLGAVLGDLSESFVKRRLGYQSGKPFVPFDQTDFVIGAVILVSFFVSLSLEKILIILGLSFILHIVVNHLAFYLRIRGGKW